MTARKKDLVRAEQGEITGKPYEYDPSKDTYIAGEGDWAKKGVDKYGNY